MRFDDSSFKSGEAHLPVVLPWSSLPVGKVRGRPYVVGQAVKSSARQKSASGKSTSVSKHSSAEPLHASYTTLQPPSPTSNHPLCLSQTTLHASNTAPATLNSLLSLLVLARRSASVL